MPTLMMLMAIAASDGTIPEKVDEEPVVSKEEIKQLEEEQERTSKYLLIGTAVAIPPGILAAMTGITTIVSGGSAAYFMLRLVDLELSGTRSAHATESQRWSALALSLGGIASSCSLFAVISCVVSVGSFGAGVKAYMEDPKPDE